MARNRVIVAFGIVLFLVLAGTGTANALWSALTSTGGTVSAGRVGITQSGFESLAVEYNSSTTLKVAPVTVTNTGSLAVRYSLLMRGPSDNTIATSASVQTRTVASAAACTSTTISTTYKWTTIPAVTGALEPGASAVICVQSSMTAAQVSATSGRSMQATLALTASATGSWSASDDGTATQSSRDSSAPSKPATLAVSNTSGYSTTLSWPDTTSTDNVAVVGYDLYRNGSLIASDADSPYVDRNLTRNTTYSYTLRARDAAGNTSNASDAAFVRTLTIASNTWYTITASQRSSSCIDAESGSTANRTELILWSCNNQANQAWAFVPIADGTYRIAAGHISTSGWSVQSTTNGAPAVLWAYNNDAASQWRAVPIGTSGSLFQFVNVASGRCLDLSGGSTATNTSLIQSTCGTPTGTNRQVFTIALR